MEKEITFRRAAVGGFNRSDVVNYINSLAIENMELRKSKDVLDNAKAEINRLKSELDAKNAEIAQLQQQITDMQIKKIEQSIQQVQPKEEVKAEIPEAKVVDPKLAEYNETADKLMRESMAYADRYVASANMVADNIRKETIERVKDADLRVRSMLERAMVFSQESESFETMLKFFKAQLDEIKKGFEE